uniref:Uncharacterized protein n=1 Tax=Aegilops tauschii subsp. strangulata TaxID=200361 RepID=A0A453ACV2_AEGTS
DTNGGRGRERMVGRDRRRLFPKRHPSRETKETGPGFAGTNTITSPSLSPHWKLQSKPSQRKEGGGGRIGNPLSNSSVLLFLPPSQPPNLNPSPSPLSRGKDKDRQSGKSDSLAGGGRAPRARGGDSPRSCAGVQTPLTAFS